MKGKIKKLFCKRNIMVAIVVLILAVMTAVSVREYYGRSGNLNTNLGKISETVTINGSQTKITINGRIIQTDDGKFSKNGLDIIKGATSYLGREYGKFYSDVAKGEGALDCSQFVQSSLINAGITSIGGFYVADGHGYPVPEQSMDWLRSSKPKDTAWAELAYYYNNTTGGTVYTRYYYGSSGTTNKISNSEDSFKINGHENEKVNVLKVNDPITDNLRYYEYYDENNNKKELPMGTVIVSYGSYWVYGNWDTGYQNHMWIYIGDLGTSDAKTAVSILNKMGINCSEDNVKSNGDSTHWRIECAGSTGVTINNGNPDMGDTNESDNGDNTKKKRIGTIWAFQVANDSTIPNTVKVKINKTSTEDNTTLNNAKFEYYVSNSANNIGTRKGEYKASETVDFDLEYGETSYIFIRETKAENKYTMDFFNNKTNYIILEVHADEDGKITLSKSKLSNGSLGDYEEFQGVSTLASYDESSNTINVNVKNKPEKTTYTVKKEWDDNNNVSGLRPDEVEVYLLKNGTVLQQAGIENPIKLNNSNSWKYQWTNLEKYDNNGNKIKYTVKETDINNGYRAEYIESETEGTIKNTLTAFATEYGINIQKIEKTTDSSDINIISGAKFEGEFTQNKYKDIDRESGDVKCESETVKYKDEIKISGVESSIPLEEATEVIESGAWGQGIAHSTEYFNDTLSFYESSAPYGYKLNNAKYELDITKNYTERIQMPSRWGAGMINNIVLKKSEKDSSTYTDLINIEFKDGNKDNDSFKITYIRRRWYKYRINT